MYKLGDKVQISKGPLSERAQEFLRRGHIEHDRIYTITRFCDCLRNVYHAPNNREVYLDGQGYYASEYDLIPMKLPEPKSEVEWLDRIQENFKRGV